MSSGGASSFELRSSPSHVKKETVKNSKEEEDASLN